MKRYIIGLVLFFCFVQFDDTSDFTPDKRNFEFTYEVTLSDLPDDAKEVEMFVPVPQDNKHQKIKDVEITTDHDYSFQTDPIFNNKILHLTVKGKAPEPLRLKMKITATRYAISSSADYNKEQDNLHNYLRSDSLVPIDSTIEKEAFEVVKADMARSRKTRSFYDHLIETMEYDKSGEGWGRGDALYACSARKGNCTDFHSLFIGMNRVVDIPARFKIGFPLPLQKKSGTIGGYHCWAEFYMPEKGWVPVDISEAAKHPEKREFFYGSLDAHRLQFSMGRDIPITTNEGRTRKLNFLIYPYVLVDNRTYRDVKTEFSFKDLDQ